MAKQRDGEHEVVKLQLELEHVDVPVPAARKWLLETPHRAGCQCHRCCWAHGVVAGRIKVDFETWRGD